MMKSATATLSALALSLPVAAQDDRPVKLSYLCRVNGGMGVRVDLPDGKTVSCHVEVTATRSRLVANAVSPSADGALVVEAGSQKEASVLRALELWVAQSFSDQERSRYLAMARLPTPQTQEQDDWSQRVELLRVLRLYKQVSRPNVAKVFAGKGTVSLSLRLTLGSQPPRILLWRRFDEDKFARLYIAPDPDPVAFDSRTERTLLLGIANWLAARLGRKGRGALWEGEHNADEDVRLVLGAYRGYLKATSPRLRSSGVIMDQPRGGSRRFEITDAQNRRTVLRFDFAAQTKTPGRLYEGQQLIDIGSKREVELLAMMRRAVKIRRRWRNGTSAEDRSGRLLEEQLQAYIPRFRKSK